MVYDSLNGCVRGDNPDPQEKRFGRMLLVVLVVIWAAIILYWAL